MGNTSTRIDNFDDPIKLQTYLDTHPDLGENDFIKMFIHCFENGWEEQLRMALEYGFHRGYDTHYRIIFIHTRISQLGSLKVVLRFMNENNILGDIVYLTNLLKRFIHFMTHDDADVIRLMIDAGAEVTPDDLFSLIQTFTTRGFMNSLRFIMEYGSGPNFPEGYPILVAFRLSNLDLVRLLIDNGATIHEGTLEKFLEASFFVNVDFIKSCIENGLIDLDKWGDDLLQHVCKNGQFDKVHLLLEYGVNPNVPSKNLIYPYDNTYTGTLLEYTLRQHNLTCAKYLVEYGAEVSKLPEYMKSFALIETFGINSRRVCFLPRIPMEPEVYASNRCFGN